MVRSSHVRSIAMRDQRNIDFNECMEDALTRTFVMSYILKPAGGHATELLAPHAESLVVSRPPNCQPVTRYSSGSFCLSASNFDFTNEPGCFVMPFSGKDTIKGATPAD